MSKPTHLLKKDESAKGADGKPYLYAYTDALAKRSDMIPCDSNGIPTGLAGQVGANGMRPRPADEPDPELIHALKTIDDLKKKIAQLTGEQLDPVAGDDKEIDLTPSKVVGLSVTKPAVDMSDEKPQDSPEASKDPAPAVDPESLNRNKLYAYMIRTFGGDATAHLKGNMSRDTLWAEYEKLQALQDLQDAGKHAGKEETA